MVIPSWAPPPTPEAPEQAVPVKKPYSAMTVLGGSLAIVIAAGFAIYYLLVVPGEASPPEVAVDLLLEDLANERWAAAADRFGSECSSVSAEILRLQFEPIMLSYDDHEIFPVSNSDPGDDGFVRVLGMMATDSGADNSVRADVAPTVDSQGSVAWSVCGVQIYGP